MFKEYDIVIDLLRGIAQEQRIVFDQNDYNSARLNIDITYRGTSINLTGGTVTIAFLKKDGKSVFQECTIVGATEGKVQVILNSQSLAVPGLVKAELTVELDGKTTTTPDFYFTVKDSIMSDRTVSSSNEFSIIKKAIEAGEKLSGVDLEKLISTPTRVDELNAQLAQNTNIIGFNFEQQGGVANDSAPVTARANTTLLRKLMYDLSLVGGGTISFPKGTFYFAKNNEDEIIRAYSNVNVHGVGMEQTVLKCIPETSQNLGYSFFRNLDGLENVNFRDFTVDMYDEDMVIYSSGGKAFYMQKVKNSTFKNLKLKGTPSTALGIDHLINVHIDNVHAYECGRLWGAIPSTDSSVLFDPANPVTSNPYPGGAGIGIGTGELEGEHFKITNCTAELCGHYGIFVEHQRIYRTNVLNESKDIVISNNICRNNRFAGMGIRGGTRVTMTGNQSYGNGCFGLSIDTKGNVDPIVTLKDSVIVGNSFNNNGLSGLHIDGYCNISGLSVKSNDFLKNGQYGISLGQFNYSNLVDTIQENIVIKGNTFYQNGISEVYQWSHRLIDYVNLILENNDYLQEIEPVTVNLIDDTDDKILYAGAGWKTVSAATSNLHGGTAHQADSSLGSTYAKIVFNGTGFKWFTPTGNNKGKALVIVDYGTPVIVDLYTDDKQENHSVYQISDLPLGIHTVTIDYIESKNALSSGNGITIDAIIIEGGELLNYTDDNKVRIEDGNANITLSGTWSLSTGEMFSNGRARYTNTAGSYAQFSFTGTGIDMMIPAAPNKGKARVFLDGVETVVDQYAASNEYNKKVFTASGLDPNITHTIKVEYSGFKNNYSTNASVIIDSFIIHNGNIVPK